MLKRVHWHESLAELQKLLCEGCYGVRIGSEWNASQCFGTGKFGCFYRENSRDLTVFVNFCLVLAVYQLPQFELYLFLQVVEVVLTSLLATAQPEHTHNPKMQLCCFHLGKE